MTSGIFVENVVESIIKPLRDEIANNFIFMDGNKRPPRARRAQRVLKIGQIMTLLWSANSPDVNSTENL